MNISSESQANPREIHAISNATGISYVINSSRHKTLLAIAVVIILILIITAIVIITARTSSSLSGALKRYRVPAFNTRSCLQGYLDVGEGSQNVMIYNLYYDNLFLFVNQYADNLLILNPVYDPQIGYDRKSNFIFYGNYLVFEYRQDGRLYLPKSSSIIKYYWLFLYGTIRDDHGRVKWTVSEERDSNGFISKIVKVEDINAQDCVSSAWVIKKL